MESLNSLSQLIKREIPNYTNSDQTDQGINPFTVFGGGGENIGAIINTNGYNGEEFQAAPTSRIKSPRAFVPDQQGGVIEYLNPLSIDDKIQNLDRLSDLLGRKIEQMLKFKSSEGLSIYSTDVLMNYIKIFMQMLMNRGYMKPLEKTNVLDEQNDKATNLKQKPPEALIESSEYPKGTIICNPDDLLNPESAYNEFKQSLKGEFPDSVGVLIQCSASNNNTQKHTEHNKISTQIGKNAAEKNKILVSGGSGKENSAMDVSSMEYLKNSGKKWIAVLTPEIYTFEKIAMEKLDQYKNQIQIILTPDWDTRIRVMRDIANFNNNAEIEISHGGLGTLQELLKLIQLSLEEIRDGKNPAKINISDPQFWQYFVETTLHMIDIKPTLEHTDKNNKITNYEIITFNQITLGT